MNTNILRYKSISYGLLLMVVTAIAAVAQQQNTALMSGMEANAKQLRQYTFKQRTETYHKGELKNAKVDEVHYSVSGERVSIPLNEQKAESEAPRRGPGHRVIAKKMEEGKQKMKEYVERLMSLTSRYLSSDPEKMHAALANAEMTTGGGSKLLRLKIQDYVKAGDTMTMSFDPATKRPMTTEVSTSLDDAPVNIVLAFDQIREGPSYAGKTIIRSAEKQLEIRIMTYDYRL